MKFIHLSDLHIGKRLNDFSLIEDQKYILQQILKITDREKPDALLIAGDVYDKTVPTAEAVELLDSFLSRLSERNLPVFIISGNHDSPERLAFGSSIMSRGGIHFSRVYNGEVEKYSLEDGYGTVNIFMLPFMRSLSIASRFLPFTDPVRSSALTFILPRKLRIVLRCCSASISVGAIMQV